ncbi:hypothetical protein CYMTET_49458 [Cymbomonas tetramitiformis]|uniref:Alpha-(1,6)-fucosyltransferase N- and catalytic domain-containing protein n=1 Tax=Cymbomonas tetramitiformis TaxID=36881 RepID=A0AAE0BQ70_9CHLO|nr:hypothetical protein CYMTET_49458 [Cymbomonas tetramitiformis]
MVTTIVRRKSWSGKYPEHFPGKGPTPSDLKATSIRRKSWSGKYPECHSIEDRLHELLESCLRAVITVMEPKRPRSCSEEPAVIAVIEPVWSFSDEPVVISSDRASVVIADGAIWLLLLCDAVVTQDAPQCLCREGLYGENCNLHITNTTSYLPPQFALAPCSNHVELARSLTEQLHQLQHPGRCDVARLRPARTPAHGFGAILMHMVKSITLTFKDGDIYEVPHGGIVRCYTKPLSDCAPSSHEMAGYTGRGRYTGKASLLGLQPNQFKGRPVEVVRNPRRNKHLSMPEGFEELSEFWYQSLLLEYLWRPTTSLAALVAAEKEKLAWEHPIMAMQVRHGDACEDTRQQRRCHNFEEYLVEARLMKAKYGVRNVYLATDDEAVQRAAEQNTEFNFKFRLSESRKFYGSNTFIESRIFNGQGDPGLLGLDIAIDITLMQDCDFFIGTFSSNLGRMAVMLMSARKGFIPPYISLDYAWCQSGTSVTWHVSGQHRPLVC